MKHIARYSVTERKSGKLLADGTTEECAQKLGMSYGSFLTMASRARRGIGKYEIVRIDDGPWQREYAQNWDASFGWYRNSKAQYPCDGCMRRAVCEFSDTYCPKWAAWFREAHEAAAAALGGQSR